MRVQRDPRVTVRPLAPDRYDAIHRMESSNQFGPHRIDADATADELIGALWNGVLTQCTVHATTTDELVGLVTCYDADVRNRNGWIAVRSTPDRIGSGLALLGLAHLITDLFGDWQMRSLRAETTPSALAQFASALGPVARVEGVLTGYRLVGGEPQDRILLAIDAHPWMATTGARMLRRRTLVRPRAQIRPGPMGSRR